MIYFQNYIAGKLIAPINGSYIQNVNPSTGEVYSQIPDSDAADVALAIEAAEAALPSWKNVSHEDRFKIINKIADLIEQHLEKFVAAESMDNGKPTSLARNVDIPRAVSNLRYFASAQWNFSSESHQMPGVGFNYTLRQPIGIVGCISPWNLPLYLFTWKIAPALATGNVVIAKPSEITPYTAFLFSEICIEAGLPAGVLNIVHGYGHKAGSAIVEHKKIKAISFTGGTATGSIIAKECAAQFKKVSLELGGKNPIIIFDDADFETCIDTTIRSSFANQGQICLCGSRVFIHKNIYEKFKEKLLERTNKMTIGDPTTDVDMGATVCEAHLNKVLNHIAIAVEEGGKILTGGNRKIVDGRCEKGFFIEPTIIEGLGHLCRTNQEEIFGPVITIMPFETEEEVLEMANSTEYGLACSIWTKDISKAHRMAANIDSGIVWINSWMVRDLRTPFGGMKASGVGREGGLEAMRFFTEAKNVFVKE
jgi:aminomuconate-semialdehyde/2-hydroxymuconate-6-semialdehyde dehydrogenase